MKLHVSAFSGYHQVSTLLNRCRHLMMAITGRNM